MDERLQLDYLRAERLIAGGRVVLAVFALVVLKLDSDLTAPTSRLAPVVGAFLVYSVALAAVSRRPALLSLRLRLALHFVDFLFFSLMIQLTHASVSPFFIFFLFSLITALLRFGVNGMLATSAAAALVYVGMAFSDENIRADPGYLIMRVTSLAVVTILLARLGAHHDHVRIELTKLAAWPRSASADRESVVRELVVTAADLLRTSDILLAWEEEEEPWVHAAWIERGSFRLTREAPAFIESLLEPSFVGRSFLARRAGAHIEVLGFGDGRIDRSAEWPFAASAGALSRFDSAVSVPLSGQTVSGRIFFLGAAMAHLADVMAAEVAARLVAGTLDQLNAALRSREAAVAGERLRVGRDLHDGVLQSLTGVALQLEMVRQTLASDPEGAANRLRNVQELIADDQRELRGMIKHLRPEVGPVVPRLDLRLTELARRFERQWDVRVEMDVDPATSILPDPLTGELYNTVNEAVANAAKHASASRILVAVRVSDRDVRIAVTDDGSGFPFRGTFTLEELNADRRGPVTLKERIASLGGDLLLSSSASGTTLDISIPVREESEASV